MSRYENYEIKNNVFGTLSAPISSLATTIQLNDGQGARFSVNMLATLENIENGKVMKREIVLITAINGDVLTVTRKYAPCPANDEANTQGQVSYAFSTDDTISAYIDKEHFDKIDDSINDIYDNGVNKLRTEVVSGLQIKVNAGPVLVGSAYYDFAGGNITLTDNATNYVEIDEDGNLVANTTGWNEENSKVSKIITSGGEITSINDWRLGTVGGKIGGIKIHELTEKQTPVGDDEFVIADSENIYQNKRVKFGNFQSSLSYDSEIEAGENLSQGDVVLNTFPCYSGDLVDNSIAFGGTNSKVAIKQKSNGQSFSTIDLFIGGTGNNDATGLTMTIESDNNGKPSGTALYTTHIFQQCASGKIPQSFSSAWYSGNSTYSQFFRVSNDGKKGLYFYNNPSNSRLARCDFTTAFSLSTAQTGTYIVSGSYVGAYNRHYNVVDTKHILGNYIFTGSSNNVELYSFSTDYGITATKQVASIANCVGAAMSSNGLTLYTVERISNVLHLKRYNLSTPYDITNIGTAQQDLTISSVSSSYSTNQVQISILDGYIMVSYTNNSGTVSPYISYTILNSDGTLGTVGTPTQFTLNGGNTSYLCLTQDRKVGYTGISTGGQFYTYLNAKVLDTFKKKTLSITTQTIPVGQVFRITITPTGGSGDCVEIGYIEKDTTDYNLSVYDGVDWTNDTTKYPYLSITGNDKLYYLKASVENQGATTKQAMIVRKNTSAFEKVSFDFFGISKRLSNLVAGNSYYISSIPGELATSGTGFKVGEALSSTDLLLTTA